LLGLPPPPIYSLTSPNTFLQASVDDRNSKHIETRSSLSPKTQGSMKVQRDFGDVPGQFDRSESGNAVDMSHVGSPVDPSLYAARPIESSVPYFPDTNFQRADCESRVTTLRNVKHSSVESSNDSAPAHSRNMAAATSGAASGKFQRRGPNFKSKFRSSRRSKISKCEISSSGEETPTPKTRRRVRRFKRNKTEISRKKEMVNGSLPYLRETSLSDFTKVRLVTYLTTCLTFCLRMSV